MELVWLTTTHLSRGLDRDATTTHHIRHAKHFNSPHRPRAPHVDHFTMPIETLLEMIIVHLLWPCVASDRVVTTLVVAGGMIWSRRQLGLIIDWCCVSPLSAWTTCLLGQLVA